VGAAVEVPGGRDPEATALAFVDAEAFALLDGLALGEPKRQAERSEAESTDASVARRRMQAA
jgi:hypothetical protein